MNALFRTAYIMVMVAMFFSTSGCRKKVVFTLAPPEMAAVEDFLPEQMFSTDNGDITIMADGISEVKISDVVAVQNDAGNALVSFMYTSNEGTWQLAGRLMYRQNSGKTECRAIEFSNITLIGAAESSGTDEASTAPAE